MKKLKNNTVLYNGKMDTECLGLCDAINALPGIQTFESCCGHSSDSYRIWFTANDTKAGLFFLTRCVDRRYWKYGYLWKIELSIGDMMNSTNGGLPVHFMLHSGPIVGEDSYKHANDLVKNMNYHLNHENFMKGFNLDINDFEIE